MSGAGERRPSEPVVDVTAPRPRDGATADDLAAAEEGHGAYRAGLAAHREGAGTAVPADPTIELGVLLDPRTGAQEPVGRPGRHAVGQGGLGVERDDGPSVSVDDRLTVERDRLTVERDDGPRVERDRLAVERDDRPGEPGGPSAPVAAPAAGDPPDLDGPVPDGSRRIFVSGAAVTLVAVLMFTFVLDLLVIGPVRHARDQDLAFAELRKQMALGTAVVNETDDRGRLVPLGTPLGIIEIPQLSQLGGGTLREVFFEGTTSGVLMSGPGHRRDTVLPGQAGISVIMGRRSGYGGPFADLGQLAPRQVFTVVTGQGRSAYRVLDVRRAGDPLPAAPKDGAGRLILVTATGTPFIPTGALRVDADLVTPAQPSGPRPLARTGIPADEQVLQGEPSAWLPLVLWGQVLVLAAGLTAWVRYRWGRWQTWLAALPLLLALGAAVSDQVARLLPNLL